MPGGCVSLTNLLPSRVIILWCWPRGCKHIMVTWPVLTNQRTVFRSCDLAGPIRGLNVVTAKANTFRSGYRVRVMKYESSHSLDFKVWVECWNWRYRQTFKSDILLHSEKILNKYIFLSTVWLMLGSCVLPQTLQIWRGPSTTQYTLTTIQRATQFWANERAEPGHFGQSEASIQVTWPSSSNQNRNWEHEHN